MRVELKLKKLQHRNEAINYLVRNAFDHPASDVSFTNRLQSLVSSRIDFVNRHKDDLSLHHSRSELLKWSRR